MRLEGKTAIVTGAGQGIGRAVALTFAEEGANLVVSDIDLVRTRKVVEEIEALGRSALAIKADVTLAADITLMVEQALSRFGQIDILVNGAAPTERALVPIEETSEGEWNKYMEVCLKGTFLCSKAVGIVMIKNGYGKIVNIASNAAHAGLGGKAAYNASKAGVISLTQTFAVEWGKFGINVNAVSPSVTLSAQHAFIEKAEPGRFAAIMRRYPIKRFNRPEDIAKAVLFLSSRDADNITGQEITVDSGAGIVSPVHIYSEEITE